jgi:hypothetical protein
LLITRPTSLPVTRPADTTSTRVSVQCQLDARRAIKEHAPKLIPAARLTARPPGTEQAARAIRCEQLIHKIDVLKRAGNYKLGQVGACVVPDHEGDGRVVEEAARHRRVVDIVEGGLAAWRAKV